VIKSEGILLIIQEHEGLENQVLVPLRLYSTALLFIVFTLLVIKRYIEFTTYLFTFKNTAL